MLTQLKSYPKPTIAFHGALGGTMHVALQMPCTCEQEPQCKVEFMITLPVFRQFVVETSLKKMQ